MKNILKIVFTGMVLFYTALHAANDYSECITDIYFGNGVWNTYKQAKDGKNTVRDKLLEKGIIRKEDIMYDNNPLGKKYAFKIAYNWHGMYRNDPDHDEKFKQFFDLAETYVQMKEAGQVDNHSLFKMLEWFIIDNGYPEEFKEKLKAYVYLATITHLSNVQEMAADYQELSFDKGHRVLLISHSQGNLWANDMVKTFKPWQRDYFRNVGVAVPADHLEAKSRYTTLSCDKVMMIIPGHLDWNEKCYGVEEISGHEFVRSYLRNANSEQRIFRDSEFFIKILGALDSQWITDQEIDRGTCDYRITVKHRFDPALEIGEKVYPFAPNKKLYQVNGAYVKATCGGTDFTDDWADKKENECWMISNPPKEKITKGCYITSFFDYDDEGWTIVGDAQNGNRNPDYKGGYIQATDDELGDLWYFQAPSKFSGDLSACYGSTFSFDLMQSSTNNQVPAEDIIINSTYGQITYRFGYTPGTNWTSFKKEMVETGWNRNLTEMEFKKILSSVTSIAIRGEYRNGFDIGSLDNVILGEHQ